MTKAPTPAEMSKGQSDNTNNATKKFDYTTVADRLNKDNKPTATPSGEVIKIDTNTA